MKGSGCYKYVILGAGPSGLAFANRLMDNGETSFVVLEKESEAGGLCRSAIVDGSPLDIGGGHILDTRNKKAIDYVFKFMPEREWNFYHRISKIRIGNNIIDYPFESNIWQFPIAKQVEYLMSIFKSGSNLDIQMPKEFIKWISWKLGDLIASDYMIPYNKKIWSINLNKLGTYWLYKLPDVSITDTLLSCLERKSIGKLPGHSNFYYPKKFGYGEVWKRMAKRLGDKILYRYSANSIDIGNRIVNNHISGDKVIVTIPWTTLKISDKLPDILVKDLNSLKKSSIRISYSPVHEPTDSHWTYFPDKTLAYHRVIYRSNFCADSKGCWYETNEKRAKMLIENEPWFFVNKFAYPLNTLGKPESMQRILEYCVKRRVFGLGRWGEWEHMNSDIAVEKGIELADKLSATNIQS